MEMSELFEKDYYHARYLFKQIGKTLAPGASAGVKDAAEREKKIVEMREVGDKISALDKEVTEVEAELTALTSALPNVPDERTPIGVSEVKILSCEPLVNSLNLTLNPKRTGIWALRLASLTLNAAQRSQVHVFMC